MHVDHTSTQLPWRPRQIFTSASHHIASRVEQIHGTQCVVQRSTLTVGSRHQRACHALFGPYTQCAIVRSSSIRIKTTSGSGLGLIRIGSRLGECTFSVDALKPDSIQFNAHWVSSVDRHLEEGEYATPSPQLIKETRSVPATNVRSEQDFALLDREKPNASSIAIEAMDLYSNKTAKWLSQKSPEEKAKLLGECIKQGRQ